MIDWQHVWLVALREIRERSRTRTFQISTLAILLLGVVGVAGGRFVPQFFEAEEPVLGIVEADAPSDLAPAVRQVSDLSGEDLTVVALESVAEGDAALAEERIDALFAGGELLFREREDEQLVALVQAARQQLNVEAQAADLGLTAGEIRALLEPPPVDVQVLEGGAEADEPAETFARSQVAFYVTILMFVAIITYGQWVLQGVSEEKTTRVIEVLLGSLRPRELLVGKVLGIMALGLAQAAFLVVVAMGAALAVDVVDVDWVALQVLPGALVWFLLGLSFYAFGYAAAGSLVSRQEDASSAALPLTMAVMTSYFAGIVFVNPDPGGSLAMLLSLLPPTAPVAVPTRLALGEIAVWELVLSAVLLIAATAFVAWAGGRLYAASILRGGPRIPFREAWRSAFSREG